MESLAELMQEEQRTSFTLSGLLNQLDGIYCGSGRILIMTTNHVGKLDPALIRPGRVDLKLDLQFCTPEQISDFFFLFFEEHLPPDVLHRLPVKSPAEVCNVCLSYRDDKAAAIRTLLQHETAMAAWVIADD